MITFPVELPTDSASTAISIVTSGQLTQKERTFAECLWNIQGYGEGYLFTDVGAQARAKPAAITDEVKGLLVQLYVAAHNASIQAHKLGDGTLLATILKFLPVILNILKLFGIPIPTLPIPAPAVKTSAGN